MCVNIFYTIISIQKKEENCDRWCTSPRSIRIKQQDKQKSLYITREGGGMNIRKTECGKCPGILIKNLD